MSSLIYLGANLKKPKVVLISPIADDPTSWYRGVGPYVQLQQNDHISLEIPKEYTWVNLLGRDVVVFQRPATPEHFGMLVLAKNMGLKVICDMDDDNLAVPKDNPTYPMYSQMPIKEAILNLARHCDVLTVTTEFMKRKYGIYNKNTVIIPNALDDKIVERRQVHQGARENKLLFRGTLSQQRNILTVGEQLVNISRRHPDYRFVFFGLDPYILTEAIPNHEVIPQVQLMDFYNVLSQIHAKVLYYPLHHNDHSQARSHISWLEGTYANSVVLAYKNAEFTRPGCLNYDSLTSFEDTMEGLIRGDIDIDKHVAESWDYIMSNYLLSIVNRKRLEVLQSLMG